MKDVALQVSVCICTHNPRADYFERVLDALDLQTLPKDRWELLIVDNGSREPVAAGRFDPGRWANARVVVEERLGLTFARMRAIDEARGGILVLVDDDNVLHHDYLERAVRILGEHPFLGAVGGRIAGEFEKPPEPWARRFLPYLAVIACGTEPIWGFHPGHYEPWFPRGAGMAIRRECAEAYRRQLEEDTRRQQYDRRGGNLVSAGDIDIDLTVMDGGHGVGYFPELEVTHLIPAERLTYGYLRRMISHSCMTTQHLLMSRGIAPPPRPRWLAYPAHVGLCMVQGDWHPLTWLLEFQITNGRHGAVREMNR